MSTAFEDLLERDGKLIYCTHGTSMKPMLRQGRDLVVIGPVSSRLKKNDVALYKRGTAYVLHRVIRVEEEGYVFRGDNTFSSETVQEQAVIGILESFQRKGKQVYPEDRGYRYYVHIWQIIYPVRYLGFLGRRIAVGTIRKAGIPPRKDSAT